MVFDLESSRPTEELGLTRNRPCSFSRQLPFALLHLLPAIVSAVVIPSTMDLSLVTSSANLSSVRAVYFSVTFTFTFTRFESHTTLSKSTPAGI